MGDPGPEGDVGPLVSYLLASYSCFAASYPEVSLDENLRAKEGGKEQRCETRFASLLYPSHGPLRFVLSHSRFALASMRNQAKNGAPEEEAGRFR